MMWNMLHRALLIGLATTVLMFASSLAAEAWDKMLSKFPSKDLISCPCVGVTFP